MILVTWTQNRHQRHTASGASCGHIRLGMNGRPVRRMVSHSCFQPGNTQKGKESQGGLQKRGHCEHKSAGGGAQEGRVHLPHVPTKMPSTAFRPGPRKVCAQPGGQELILAGPLMNPPAHAPSSAGTSAEPSTAALDTEDEWVATWNGEAPRSGLFLIIPPFFHQGAP